MSLSNKSAVLLFIAVLTLSVFMAPVGPVAQAEVASSPSLSPATQEKLNNWYQTVNSPGFKPEIDATLAAWMETGEVTEQMVTTRNGVSALVVTTPDVDMNAIREVVHVDMFVNLGYFQTLKVTISNPEALTELAKIKGVGLIDADLWRTPVVDDLVKEFDAAPSIPSEGVDMDYIYDTVNAGTGAAAAFNGSGITVGHVDTGADFGHPALQHAYNTGSFDGTGEGVTPMWYYANASYISNITDWVDVKGNLLTYVDENGDVWLNVTGWDPLLNNGGGVRYLYGDGGPGVPYNNRVGFIWLYNYFWIEGFGFAPMNATWLESTKQDWKLPAPGNLTTGTHYQVNWIFQQHSDPYAKIFAPALVYNGTDKDFHLMVNWDDADAWNYMWTNAFYYNSINVSHSSEGDLDVIYNKFDWNFEDEFAEGEIYDMNNPIVAYNYDGVGVDDFSLGSLSWAYDAFGFTEWGDYDWDPIFGGFSDHGDFNLYWDDGTHGTATAIHVVGKNVANFYNMDNNRTVNMTGIAPGADMISARALSGASDYFSYLWLCGFDMTNETSGEFNYTGNHMADLVTNSWGWITEPASQMNYLSFTWEILSTPDILETGYPGVLHVFSAGNEGAGYMTIGPPGSATAVLTVGASTDSNWLEYLYGPTQPYEGMASFSSRGPSFTGYPKPDVLAPGLAGYSSLPWYSQYYGDSWGSPDNTTLFAGTSQAAPVAAGVVALVMDALDFDSANGDNPFVAKLIVQATATDLGYDPAIQGFGRIDAAAACDFAANDVGMVGGTTDSLNNFAKFIGDSWAYWGILPGSYVPRDVNSSAVAFPTGNLDGAIFFGQTMPGDTINITYNIYPTAAELLADTPDETWAWGSSAAYFFNMTDSFTFTGTTFSYNDTATKQQMYGYYNITEELGGTDYATVMSADMIQIIVAFDEADVAGAYPWMFLYDWEEKSGDGKPSLNNITTGVYDELHRLTSASDASNINLMQWAPETLMGNLTLVIHDPAHDVETDWWNATAVPGNNFTVTIIAYDMQDPGVISFADDGTATASVNITLNVPNDADPGIYTGFIDFGPFMAPYSYVVVFNITEDGGYANTMFTDYGADMTPYDNVLYGSMEEDPDDWDFRSYVLYNPYDTAAYMGIRAEFATTGNDLFIALYDAENGELATSSAETATSTALLAEIDGKGYYYLLVHPLAQNGTIAQPVEFTLEVMLYDDLTDQAPILSYTSDDRSGVFTWDENGTIWGDHAVVNVSYPAFNLPNMTEFEISSVQIGFLAGIYHQASGDLVIPDSSYDPFSGPIDTTQFAWEYVDGIVEGDTVKVTVDFTNGDCDIMAWWADTDNSSWSYGNNLLEDQMATGAHPEYGEFVADRSGRLAIGIFDYDLQPGEYYVTVDTLVGVYEKATGGEVTYDTYDLGKNGTFTVEIVATTATNWGFKTVLQNVFVGNYFYPHFTGVTVTGEGASKTISWTIEDLNAQDNHTYEVLLSADDGTTFNLIATGLTDTSFVWDSTGFLIDNYIVQIRVEDSYGLTDQINSDPFSAGTVTPTEGPTGPTGPTVTDLIPPEMLLWIGLIGGIGVGVVVVLILFLVKRR